MSFHELLAPNKSVEIEDPEPWHERVDGTRLAAEIENLLNRHLVLPDHAATAITLWIIFTYVYDGFRVCHADGQITAKTAREKYLARTIVAGL